LSISVTRTIVCRYVIGLSGCSVRYGSITAFAVSRQRPDGRA
jgi:hypothetical protein